MAVDKSLMSGSMTMLLLRFMSRNMPVRRESITVLRRKAENYWKQKKRSGWNISLQ